MKTAKMLLMAAGALMILAQTACKDDADATLTQAERNEAAEVLSGDMVVSAKASIGGVDKTLLDGGAPCKFRFDKTGDGEMTLSQPDFQVGKMPFPLNFKIAVTLSPVLSLEKSDFPESGWVRFSGKRGVVSITGQMPDSAVDESAEGDGSTVTGFVNTKTREIQFQISYAMMTVEVNVPRQAIDPDRVANYEAEREQYEKDLEEYKKAHGLQ